MSEKFKLGSQLLVKKFFKMLLMQACFWGWTVGKKLYAFFTNIFLTKSESEIFRF
jgi:hypothetical protein